MEQRGNSAGWRRQIGVIYGRVAQLAERTHSVVIRGVSEVGGSIPPAATVFLYRICGAKPS